MVLAFRLVIEVKIFANYLRKIGLIYVGADPIILYKLQSYSINALIESTLCLQSRSGDLLFPRLRSPVFSGRLYY